MTDTITADDDRKRIALLEADLFLDPEDGAPDIEAMTDEARAHLHTLVTVRTYIAYCRLAGVEGDDSWMVDEWMAAHDDDDAWAVLGVYRPAEPVRLEAPPTPDDWRAEREALALEHVAELEQTTEQAARERKVEEAAERLRIQRDARLRVQVEDGGFGLFDPTLAGSLDSITEGVGYPDLIPGTIGRGELVMLVGESYSAKSFVAQDWSLSVAYGADWLGRPAQRGRVLYCAMEGIKTMEPREAAWLEHHGREKGDAVTYYPRVVNLLDPSSVSGLAAYAARERFDLIVIDTLSRSFGGADENSAEFAGRYIASLSQIREAHDPSTVLTLHHSKKDDPETPRGSSVFYAGMDRVLCLRMPRRDQPVRKLITQKDKGGAPSPVITMAFEQVGPSAVLVASDGEAGNVILRTLANLQITNPTVHRPHLIDVLVNGGEYASRDSAGKVLRRLIERGQIAEADGVLTLP